MQSKKSCPFLIFKIENEREVVVEHKGEPGDTYESFKDKMMEASKKKEARYAVYDVYDDNDTGKNKTGKLLLIFWADDDLCAVKQKMLYSSSIQAVRKACAGYHKELECHEESDMNMQCFREKIGK